MNCCREKPKTAAVIEKWYRTLGFPQCYDREFHEALDTIPVSPDISIDTYDLNCPDGKKNLLSMLYLCEGVAEKYRELGIAEEILIATLQDIVRWTGHWSKVKGELFLGELPWLSRHMHVKLFKVGRLQFYMAPAEEEIPQFGIRKGDNVVELHIHHGGKLTPEAVQDSLRQGKEFLGRYFPDYTYTWFTCHSWLLDEKLKEYLPADSNIIRFGDLFTRVEQDDSNALLRFLFRWDTNEENLSTVECRTELHRKIKAAVLSGETFHEVLGVLKA